MNPLPSRSAEPLERLLRDSPHLWRGESLARIDTRATCYAALDAHLPGGGWPIGALVEIAPACDGLGELSLTLPALRSWCREGRSVAFVHPPYTPYAPALGVHQMTPPRARDPIYRRRRFEAETIEKCVRWYITGRGGH